MLIAFRAENFKCFNQEISYSLISNEEDVNFTNVGMAPILNQLSISGAPSTGKTSTLEILKFIKDAVSTGNIDKFPKLKPYKFENDVVLEVILSINKQFYCYGFSFNQNIKTITGEWINLLCSDGKSTMLYSRDDINFSLTYHEPIEKDDHKFFDVYIKDIKPNQLGLTSIAEHNCENAPSLIFFNQIRNYLSYNIIEIFSKDQIISTNDILNTPELCDLSNFLHKLDTGISAVTKEPCTPIELSKYQYRKISQNNNSICLKTNNSLIHIKNTDGQIETNEIKFCHGFGKRRFTISFSEESRSNQRIIELALLIMNSKNKDNVFIIDDLDQALSQTQANNVLELLRDKTNDEEQQLIFTTSDLFLPNENIFSFEQYWNTYRNKYEECYAIQNESNDFECDDYDESDDLNNDDDNDFTQNQINNCNNIENEFSNNQNVIKENLSYNNEELHQSSESEVSDLANESIAVTADSEQITNEVSQSKNYDTKICQDNMNSSPDYSLPLPETNVDILTDNNAEAQLPEIATEEHNQIQHLDNSESAVPKTKKVRLTIKKVKDIIRSWNDRDINSQNEVYVHIRNNKIDITTLDTNEKINQTYIDMYDFLIAKEEHKKYSKRLSKYLALRTIYKQHINEQINCDLINSTLEQLKQNQIINNEVPQNNEINDELNDANITNDENTVLLGSAE